MIVSKYENINGKSYVEAKTYDEVLYKLKATSDKLAKKEETCKGFAETSAECAVENVRLKKRIAELERTINHELGDWDKQGISYQEILDMREENYNLKKRIDELENEETTDLPFDALGTANYLINSTYKRETNGFKRAFHNLPEKVNSDRYTIDDLEQIAEHLLVYCRHNRENEE